MLGDSAETLAGQSTVAVHGVSTTRADSHVPMFDNTAKNYPEYRRRCEVYRQKMELAGRSKETIFNLVTVMSGRSWDLVEDLDVSELSNDGFKKVFERLDKAFQFDPLTELPGDFEKFFITMNRRAGQTLQDYTQEFTYSERRLRTIHKVDLPDKVKAWFFLRRSGLSKEQRLLVLSSVGHDQLDLETVQKTMNFVIGQDTKLEGTRWNRNTKDVYYAPEEASSPWNGDEDSWDYGSSEAAYWQDYDDDVQWPDYDASYFDDTDIFHADEQESEVYDVAEYDDVYANFIEAKSRLNQVRMNRGFYPVVALMDAGSSQKGSGKQGSKPRSKGKSKGKSKGSKSSSSAYTKPPGAKARGKAAMAPPGGRQFCVRCGGSGHQANKCPALVETRSANWTMTTRCTWWRAMPWTRTILTRMQWLLQLTWPSKMVVLLHFLDRIIRFGSIYAFS